MERLREKLQKHRFLSWILTQGYVVFNGCFMFPFSNELFPFDIQKGVLLSFGYGMVGILYAGLINRGKALTVFLLSFSFTVLGLVFRYLLEYGEISNERNFTQANIVLYLMIIPLYCLSVYCIACKID